MFSGGFATVLYEAAYLSHGGALAVSTVLLSSVTYEPHTNLEQGFRARFEPTRWNSGLAPFATSRLFSYMPLLVIEIPEPVLGYAHVVV